MQIPVSGMEHVDGRDTRCIRFVVDQLEEFGEGTLGDDGILHDEVGAELPHQPTGDLAGLPQLLSLQLIIAVLDLHCARVFHQLGDRFDAGIDKNGRAFDLRHDEERILGEPDSHRAVLDHRHESRVHQLDGDREGRVLDQSMDGAFGGMEVRESGSVGPRLLRARQQSQPETSEGAEGSLRPDHQPLPVVVPVSTPASWSPKSMDAAVEHHDFQPQHIVAGNSIPETVGSARIHRHISAECTHWPTRGIGGIEQPIRLECLVELVESDAAFHLAPVSVTVD